MTSWTWAGAFVLAAVVIRAMRTDAGRELLLLVMGAALVVFADPQAAIVLLLLALITHGLVRNGRPAVAVVAVVLLLVGWKLYAGYRLGFTHAAGGASFVPLGLSYAAFQAIHYAVEARRGKIRDTSLRSFLHFLFFFPTVAAGPIKRFEEFRTGGGLFSSDDFKAGGLRIFFGLVKVLLLAPAFRLALDAAIGATPRTTADCWIILYAGALWIYLDFSGYTDLAVGASRILGYRVPENFDWPYLKTNIRDFWRAWHKSLSFWIRDYLYIPMGGSRKGRARTYAATLAAMLVMGLWHGLSSGYVLWGLWHGLGLVAYSAWRHFRAAHPQIRAAHGSKRASEENGDWCFFPSPRGKLHLSPFSSNKNTEDTESTEGKNKIFKSLCSLCPLCLNFKTLSALLSAVATFHFVALGWLFFFFDGREALRVMSQLIGLGGIR